MPDFMGRFPGVEMPCHNRCAAGQNPSLFLSSKEQNFVALKSLMFLCGSGADREIFQRGLGWLRRKIFKEKCLLIHVSTRLQRKTRQTCNSFSLFPFQEVCLTYFALFYYFFYFWNVRGGGVAHPVTPL